MLGRRAKVAVIVALAAILAVEGYFVYEYYQRYYWGAAPAFRVADVFAAAEGSAAEETSPVNMPEGTAPAGEGEATSGEDGSDADAASTRETDDGAGENGAAFVHRATPDNVDSNSTYIDHPLSNGNPDAAILITPVWDPEDDVNNARPVGVWYNADRDRWAVFNQDRTPMPEAAAFNVVVLEKPVEGVFVHRAAPGNTDDNSTYVDDPLTNGNPNAAPSVTPNWNPGGRGGTYDDHPVGVFYDDAEEQWAVFNQDGAAMPQGAAFIVAVSGLPAPTT